MHQPPYLNPRSGTYRLPWVFLHGLKDYYDMPALLRDFEDTRVTINLVPSLMAQIQDYEGGQVQDRYLEVASAVAEDFSERERDFVARFFFPFPDEITRLHSPYYLSLKKRLRTLEATRGASNGGGHAEPLSPSEYRDIQVLFLLSWCGETLRREPLIAALLEKGRGYSIDEQRELLQALHAFIPRILPEHAAQVAAGKLEVTVSPYSHPILPLLINIENGRVAKPGATLPDEPFAWPLDARLHLALAQERYRDVFGHPARGMWPSEGSVSPEAFRLIREEGLEWIVTDIAILEKALGRAVPAGEALRPYRYEGLNVFFRDTSLSDLIGFTYSSWRIDEAVADFLRRVRHIAATSPLEHPVLTVAMDGENAWEHFEDGGYAFLAALYAAIEAAPDIDTVTFSGYLDAHPEAVQEVGAMGTGSWIYGDFSTWIGDPYKNQAWAVLSNARRELQNHLRESRADLLGAGSEHHAEGRPHLLALGELPEIQTLLRAESSDWFWWYGEGHSSINDPDFDYLFRANLRHLYALMGKPAPARIEKPLTDEQRDSSGTIPPRAFICPCITGEKDNYFEWLSAGRYELQAGALQKVNPHIRQVSFGFDERNLFLRVDTFGPAREQLLGMTLELRFPEHAAAGVRLAFGGGAPRATAPLGFPDEPVATTPGEDPCDGSGHGVNFAIGRVVEVRLPLARLFPELKAGASVGIRRMLSFNVRVFEGAPEPPEEGGPNGDPEAPLIELERFPWNHDIEVCVNTVDLETENWFV